jgi:hypothetical protein
MTKSRPYLVAAALLFAMSVAAPAWAQTPNLSGTWKFDASKSTGDPVVPRIFNPTGVKPTDPTLVIKQSPTELAVNIGDARLLYKLDGTEANISAEGRAGFPVGKAAWEKGRLVITLTQEVFNAAKGDYMKVPGKEVYSLNGNTLTVEKSQTMVNGTVQTKKLVYTKSST